VTPLLTGFAFGGAGTTPKATVSGTTGSPTIDTTSRPGKTIYKFTGSGSITIGTAGTCEVLVVGGGAGGAGFGTPQNVWGGGGGAGGVLYNTSSYVPTGTLTVTIGAAAGGGYPNSSGNFSAIAGQNTFSLVGGGGGGSSGGVTSQGSTTATANSITYNYGQGYAGGTNPTLNAYSGGGGGAGGTGGNSTASAVGAGGAGYSSSITGSSVSYGTGGAGAQNGAVTSAVNGAANTGNGGNGSSSTGASVPGAGGSGYVVVVIG
jgi:hypothetical protein